MPYQIINRRHGLLVRAWWCGIIHAIIGMIIVALLCALTIIMAGVFAP